MEAIQPSVLHQASKILEWDTFHPRLQANRSLCCLNPGEIMAADPPTVIAAAAAVAAAAAAAAI